MSNKENQEQNFNFSFAQEKEGFESHIEKSIPGYETLYDTVVRMSEYFIEENTQVIDLGCSTGRMIVSVHKRNKSVDRVDYYGIEYEAAFKEEMKIAKDVFDKNSNNSSSLNFITGDARSLDFSSLDKAADSLQGSYSVKNSTSGTLRDIIDNNNLKICGHDDYDDQEDERVQHYDHDDSVKTSFAMSIFTLQFIPKQARKAILEDIVRSMSENGAFVISEKVYSVDPRLQEMMTFLYYDYKQQSFDASEILEKEKRLRPMLRPMQEDELIQTLHEAGFETIQCFWRNYNFVAYICTNPRK